MTITVPSTSAAAVSLTGTSVTALPSTPITQTTIPATIVPSGTPLAPPAAAAAQVQQATGAPPANPCQTSDWGPWGPCDQNMGNKSRTRTVTSGDCTGVELTSVDICPVDAQAGPWSAWGPCDPMTGTQTRTRSIVSESMNGGVAAASIATTQTQSCPVDCRVGDWGPWSACQGGKQSHTRSVSAPALNGGAACGDLSATQACQDPVPSLNNQRLTWGNDSGRYLGCYGGQCNKGSWVKSQAMGGVAGAKNGQTWSYNSNNTITSNGQCLDVKNSGKDNGTQVDTFSCNNTGAQTWIWDFAGDHYRLKNPMSGRCLDVPHGGNMQDGIGMAIWDCGGAAGQAWRPV